MSGLMATLEWIKVYLDDLLIITRGNFEDHLDKLRQVLQRLQDAGLRINADKSIFGSDEVEYLGYVLTRNGIKPQRSTVAEMLVIQLIQNPNYLHRGVRFSVKLPVLQKFLQICLILHKNHKIIAKRGLLLTDYLQNPLFGDMNY